MAYNDNQKDFPLPAGGNNNKRESASLLPKYFRTKINQKFLSSTLDQLIQPGVAEKIDAYYGRKTAKSFKPTDSYIEDVSEQRQNRQLEPAAVVKDELGNVVFYKEYTDLVNQIKSFGGNVSDHSVLNGQEYYAWDPAIDWDKFVNFREYYWLPTGPQTVSVFGQTKEITSTYTVTTEVQDDNTVYKFSPPGFTPNPTLRLYRGQKYRFEIDCPGHPIAFAVNRTFLPGDAVVVYENRNTITSGQFDVGLFDSDNFDYSGDAVPQDLNVTYNDPENISSVYQEGITYNDGEGNTIETVYIEKGVIEFTVPLTAPDKLFYVSRNDINTSGLFKVFDITEASELDVENDILGKKTYKSGNGVEFTNGMKVEFGGFVTPEKYATGNWYIEGVGSAIKLIAEDDLDILASYTSEVNVPFDSDAFDRLPFNNANSYAGEKDYIVINRASTDLNPWSRYNRWFHKDVIEKSALYNNSSVQATDIDQSARAKRPIIEFEAGLKLFNFGTYAKQNVDLIDDFTTDVFSTIEGSLGYNIDGVDIAQGMRILFTADTDKLVNGKIYTVNFVKIGNRTQISLIETEDTLPIENETVLSKFGSKYAGKILFYTNGEWKLSQQKNTVNQPPLFELFDKDGNSFSDPTYYEASNFAGCKVFSYRVGTQEAPDTELGFPLDYRTIENIGDIIFDFNLLTDSFNYQLDNNLEEIKTELGFLRKYNDIDAFTTQNSWKKAVSNSKQYVISQYIASVDNRLNLFPINCYDNSGTLTDLKTVVYVNNKLQIFKTDYEIMRVNSVAYIRFFTDLVENDIVRLKTTSKTPKNENGYYEIAHNLERNPLNENVISFTFGEVTDHVESIVESLYNYNGKDFPGFSNLRDLGDVDAYGKRFVQHSGPLNLALFHITDKETNVINAVRFARTEYAKFKRVFFQAAENLDFDGSDRQTVDKLLEAINAEKTEAYPFFFSDMTAYTGAKVQSYEVFTENNSFYALSEIFELNALTNRAVYVYLNGVQLTYGKDYTFNSEGFVNITAKKQRGDLIEIVEFDNTDGSFIPPTPTKLGLYPKFEPELIIDTTYRLIKEEYTVKSSKTIFAIDKVHSIVPNRSIIVRINGAEQQGNYTIETDALGNRSVVFDNAVRNNDSDTQTVVSIEYPRVVIQGHDGSITLAFNDYRDNLVLELEKRIFNNIKQAYNGDILDIHDFLDGESRDTGVSKKAIDEAMLSDFAEWLSLAGDPDYTTFDFHDFEDSFTYNYTGMTSYNGTPIKGFWRNVYKYAYDTDRPHTHPWEMLDFFTKPEWWDEVYGPAPYTSGNMIMWKDIEEGRIAEPGKTPRIKSNYVRPNLTKHLPVDSKGNLVSPLTSGYAKNFVASRTKNSFKFGDQAPTETAWRRSSEYPFALMTAWLLNQPAKIMGIAFDISRIERNSAGNLVYTPTQKAIELSELLFPNTYEGDERIITSGLVNYVYNYTVSNVTTSYVKYQEKVKSIKNNLALKVGGFTEKSKFKLILDSRTPLNEGNVFVPPENYQIFLNTSSPVESVNYSAVIIEKETSGFIIRGYNSSNPVFKYHKPIEQQNDPTINVGGVSETFVNWDSRKQYIKGQNVEYNNSYYRCLESHVSGASFDTTKFSKLPRLPLIGGRDAVFRRSYTTTVLELPYGSLLKTIQDVVDFLLGYQSYLESQGFIFDSFNNDLLSVENFNLSAKEFMLWTTQNWAAGSIISLSPFANRLTFKRDYMVSDNVFDNFYTYTLLKADGEELDKQYARISRSSGNDFEIEIVNTDDGIYNVTLPLVQKEHVVLIDNTTKFNDVVYQMSTGYRQERVKVAGYRSDNWNGGLNIPGFIYDEAVVTDWEIWKDYPVGSLVKYKEFYYVAKNENPGTDRFNFVDWERLDERPESSLLPNFEYKVNQFGDFYDLDSDNFDSEQQRFAQHLIGYQKRQYLQNIINDDVSQYKFYQGMIADKGTKNVLTKLFDALSTADKDSLEFYEEWAIRVGQYGATENFEEVEFLLDETKFRISPQPIELVNTIPANSTDLVYRQVPNEVYSAPVGYNHAPFPVTSTPNFLRSAGYVNEDNVNFRVLEEDAILDADIDAVTLGSYTWVVNTDVNWDVLQHIPTDFRVESIAAYTLPAGTEINSIAPTVIAYFDKTVTFKAGDIIGLQGLLPANNAFYKVYSANNNSATLVVSDSVTVEDQENASGYVTVFRSVRASTSADINNILNDDIYADQRIWIDNKDSSWKLIEQSSVYNVNQEIQSLESLDDSTETQYGSVLASDSANLLLATSDYTTDTVYTFRRSSESNNLVADEVLQNFKSFFLASVNVAANPLEVTLTRPHGLVTGQTIKFRELNTKTGEDWNEDLSIVRLLKRSKGFEIEVVDATTIKLLGVDTSLEGLYADQLVEFNNTIATGEPGFTEDGIEPSTTLFVTDLETDFGKGLAISPDGKFLAIGSPRAGNLTTKYRGAFNVNGPDDAFGVYSAGDIVLYNENLWKARSFIEPAQSNVEFNSFDSYAFLESDVDSSLLTLLLLGNPYVEELTTDHLLLRAPKTAYEGTKSGDSVVLEWNKFTHLNRANGPLTNIQPFDNKIAEIKDNFISDTHEIVAKIDNIIYVERYSAVPKVGDTVVTSSGQAKVADIYRDDNNLVIYTQGTDSTFNEVGTNGTLLSTDEVYVNDTLIGTYTQPHQANVSNVGGWWKISIGQTIDNTLYDIFNKPYWNDDAYGLVYRDIKLAGDSSLPNYYYNIQNDVFENIDDGYIDREISFIAPLSYRGTPNDILDNYDSSEWVLRMPASNTYGINDTFKLWVNNSEDSFNLENINMSFDAVNSSVHTIKELWDGYIDIEFDNFQTVDEDGDGIGDPFEPEIGSIIFTSLSAQRATVKYYQKDGINSARLYLTVEGDPESFTVGSTVVREGDGISIPNRIMGNITNASLSTPTNNVGKLALIDYVVDGQVTNIPVDEEFDGVYFEQFFASNIEYWIYQENTVLGEERLPSYPSSTNSDWTRVSSIPVDNSGYTTETIEQGKITIYERQGTRWNFVNEYIIPTSTDFSHVGAKIKFAQDKELYRLYVVEKAEEGSEKIHFIYHGTDVDGTEYDWSLAYDPNYRGEFDTNLFYKTGELVLSNISGSYKMYRALTNIAAGTFNSSRWEEVLEGINFTASIPLPVADRSEIFYTDFTYYNDYNLTNEFLPTIEFAYDFDVNADGTVLAVSVNTEAVGELDNRVLVYRLTGSNYRLTQVIDSFAPNTEFGESISLSEDGTILAIGDSKNDTVTNDNGRVYIYRLTNGEFVLNQTINSPSGKETEYFGANIDIASNNLFVASYNGDVVLPVTYDVYSEKDLTVESKYVNNQLSLPSGIDTLFDGGFTTFKNKKRGSGLVSVYQDIDNKFSYGEALTYPDVKASNFGETIVARANHVYVGMPRFVSTFAGQILDFRRNKETHSWKIINEQLPVVDTAKIKQVFLYNTKTGKLVDYLDYIDPRQGKIAGPAEQEIYYKMFAEPALYNSTRITEFFSETDSWGKEQVGRLWWDLSTVKFKNANQSTPIWQANNWNQVIPGTSVDVYEWVESDMLPDDWDNIADTPEGELKGISGQSKYGNAVYSQQLVYDDVGQSFTTKFYFWVKDKKTIPNIENRSVSTFDVKQLIANPASVGYKFVAFLTNNRFVIYNCDSLIQDKDIALSVRYYTDDTQEQNVHREYQIISEGLETSRPKADIETKWFDSLVGSDIQQRPVPDPALSLKNRYGNLFNPRQSWFINRHEALKQVIERANISLSKKIVVDEYNLSKINEKDPMPLVTERRYDVKVNTDTELNFIGTSKVETATLRPIIVNGKIVAVSVENPGRGYKDPTYEAGISSKRYGPSVTIVGKGTGAELELEIDNLGKVTKVNVLNEGDGYDATTQVIVRKLTVLVETDTSIRNRWALYQWNTDTEQWFRTDSQDYDVTLYWDYADWYAQGYNQFTPVVHVIDYSYELFGLEDRIGDVVKINNIGSGGWLLLKKVDDQVAQDYSVNYETIGRQNGTIQFKSSLYDYVGSALGFDSYIYDGKLYDTEPTTETRKILESLRDDLLVDDLAKDYNELFFASLRYVFSEQPNVDWAFKTSFVKAKHNVGELTQKVTFQNDNLPSYNDYINEVKPFKTKIREYLSSYEKVEPTNSVIADFDVPPAYDSARGGIYPKRVRILDNEIVGEEGLFDTYPDKNWLDQVGFKVVGIHISDAGKGYKTAPKVTITGGGGSGAEAKAYIGQGKVTKVVITNPGSGYLSAPAVTLQSNLNEGGAEARLSAEIGDTVVRSMHVSVKFDRVTGEYTYTSLPETETFTGTAVNSVFKLKWPMDMRTNKVRVLIDGVEVLRSRYTFDNVLKDSITKSHISSEFNYGGEDVAAGLGVNLVKDGYTQKQGVITFVDSPALGSVIEVQYYKNLSLFNATDRLYHFYKPTDGMLGNRPGLLMNGVDYGGVEVRSFDFDGPAGWDTDGWYSSTWDTYDNTFEDEIFYLRDETTTLELAKALEDGIVYNVYKNGVRIDDPNFGTATPVTNPNAEMPSLTGDGETTVVNLGDYGVIAGNGDIFVVRKITSDGSFLPDPNSFDTLLQGGALDYSNAKGTAPEEMIVDGDGFVTPTTSGGPEELVPGQILDTVDIKVFERAGPGQGEIYNQNYKSDGVTATYPLGIIPATNDSLMVKVAGVVLENNEYVIDYANSTVTLTVVPALGTAINIISIGASGNNVLDIDTFVTDGSTVEFATRVQWQDNLSFFITANGETVDNVELVNVDNTVVFKMPELTVLEQGTVISYGLFVTDTVDQFSLVQSDSFKSDGVTVEYTLSQSPVYKSPSSYYTIVRVDNTILSAGYNKQFTVSTLREYELDKFQTPTGTLAPEDLEVYLNGSKLENITQWTLNIGNSSVVLREAVGQVGDILEVYLVTGATYEVIGNRLVFATAPAVDADIEVTQFSNHDVIGLERRAFDVVSRSSLTIGSDESATFRLLTGGKLVLDKAAKSSQYVWVSVNGKLLTPNVDYSLDPTRTVVQLLEYPTENDVVEVIHFSDVQSVGRFAWRQFKDILNRTHYKRIDRTTVLAKALNNFDVRIEVEDASVLPEPNKAANIPGVIFIEGERIEYFIKDGNLLRQLRRGTLGTSVKEHIAAGTTVYDQGTDNNVPYKDQLLTQVFEATEAQDTFQLDFTPNSVNEFEVFVAGRRLRKNSISRFDLTVDQASPAADVIIPAEFSVNGSSLVLDTTVADTVAAGQKVMVIRKLGKTWTTTGVSMLEDEGIIAKFLRQGQTNLPE